MLIVSDGSKLEKTPLAAIINIFIKIEKMCQEYLLKIICAVQCVIGNMIILDPGMHTLFSLVIPGLNVKKC